MNIFVLDSCPKRAAEYHCDRHLGKMILETSQMLCANIRVLDPTFDAEWLYKKSHVNHPCTIWLRLSYANVLWVFELVSRLHELHGPYKSFDVCVNAVKILANCEFYYSGLTPFARAMPDKFADIADTVEAYRAFYPTKAERFDMSYKNRSVPFFMTEVAK